MSAVNRATFSYKEPFPLGKDQTKYRLVTKKFIRLAKFQGKPYLVVQPQALTILAYEAFRDISFLLRSSHLEQLAAILQDPEASCNDRTVASALLKNAAISAKFELPMCQDTGTATVIAKKGERVLTGTDDAKFLSKGIWKTYHNYNLRYSQLAPLTIYKEKNTGTNLPAQIDIYTQEGMEYEFLFLAKGGGSANKTYLFHESKALLNPVSLKKFLSEKMKTLGTAACPPYHLAFVIGGTSAEACLKTVKLASARYLDNLPAAGNISGHAFRDPAFEEELLQEAFKSGIGAQFGGKYFALDVRVIRLPRHGASCPIGMGVSCSADRHIKAKISKTGIWLEELEKNPERYLPKETHEAIVAEVLRVDLNRPMKEIVAELSKHPIGTELHLAGRLIVARDIAHAKLKERLVNTGELPSYFKNHPVYYAGPAKTPKGKPSGSFGPTTSARMDPYVELFQSNGGSIIMIGKGNRSAQAALSCKKYGGFYLGSVGGAAALLAERSIKKVEAIDYQDLGMEAVWAIEVEDFPAFILINDKGHDFFGNLGTPPEI